MSPDSAIRCACGYRITERDVQQQGFVMSRWKPVFVYLRYRCPNCRASGEELIGFEDWDISLLRHATGPAPQERERIAALGLIEPDEIIEFSRRISREGGTSLRELVDRPH